MEVLEEELKIADRLPSHEKVYAVYANSRKEILNDCLATQNYPFWKWHRRDIEAWLLNPWIPIPWTDSQKKVIPFGYKKDPKLAKKHGVDPDTILFPIPDELFALEEAKRMVGKFAVESIVDWLKEKTGRKISVQGFRDRYKNDKRRQSRAVFYRKLAARIAKALITAEKIESEWPGAKVPWARLYDQTGEKQFEPGNVKLKDYSKLWDLFKVADPRPFIERIRQREAERLGQPYVPFKNPEIDYYCGDRPTCHVLPPARRKRGRPRKNSVPAEQGSPDNVPSCT